MSDPQEGPFGEAIPAMPAGFGSSEPASDVSALKTPGRLRLLTALRQVSRAVDVYSRQLISSHRVTGPQLLCLNTIVDATALTATELARAVQLSPSTVVRILDRLENKGLIQRERSPADRRRVRIQATAKGHQLSLQASYAQLHPLLRALDRLEPREQESVTATLERLVHLMAVEPFAEARADTRSRPPDLARLGPTSPGPDMLTGGSDRSR
jgi:DNA-binding MarR family transcriptional regulator